MALPEPSSIVVAWSPREVRAPLADINASFLELLVDMARSDSRGGSDFLSELREPLSRLAEPVKLLAARIPFLLLDVEFRNHAWWKACATNPAKAFPPPPTWTTALPRLNSLKLARPALVLAWHLARTDRESCLIAMGMSAAVIDVVRLLQLQQIEAIAEQQCTRLRPRWEDRPALWRQLLATAATGQPKTRDFVLHALQMSGSASPAQP
jgi:hypothetical protein